jgi:hypothetical protein
MLTEPSVFTPRGIPDYNPNSAERSILSLSVTTENAVERSFRQTFTNPVTLVIIAIAYSYDYMTSYTMHTGYACSHPATSNLNRLMPSKDLGLSYIIKKGNCSLKPNLLKLVRHVKRSSVQEPRFVKYKRGLRLV